MPIRLYKTRYISIELINDRELGLETFKIKVDGQVRYSSLSLPYAMARFNLLVTKEVVL